MGVLLQPQVVQPPAIKSSFANKSSFTNPTSPINPQSPVLRSTIPEPQYQEHYAGAAFDLILVDGQPAGRLYVAREGDEIRIVDIALLLDRRGDRAVLREVPLDPTAACSAAPFRPSTAIRSTA